MTHFTTQNVQQSDGRFALYKNYHSSCSRIEKVKEAWTNALQSRGKSLFERQWWNLIKAAILGWALSQSKYKSRLKIHTLNSTSFENPGNTSNLQSELDGRRIALNLTPPSIEKSNSIDLDAKKELLASLKSGAQRRITNLLFDSMEYISFEKLLRSLSACTSKLSEKLNGCDYQVGFAPKKSQKWIAELAIPFLNKTPKGSFVPAIDTIGSFSTQGPLSNESHIVVFDDCSYSGVQLNGLIKNIRKQALETFGRKKITIHIVVPFISSVALERLKVHENSDSEKENYKVHIYTSNNTIPLVKDRLTKEEYSMHESADSREKNPACEEFIANKCLAYTEWKVPDTKSIPMVFSQIEKKVFGDNPPPYKQDY